MEQHLHRLPKARGDLRNLIGTVNVKNKVVKNEMNDIHK